MNPSLPTKLLATSALCSSRLNAFLKNTGTILPRLFKNYATLLAHPALVRQELPHFMLDPPGCAADVWLQIYQLVGRSRTGGFYLIAVGGAGDLERNGVLTGKGVRYEASRKLTGLSHRLLKFYTELKDIAEKIATVTVERVWKYGYILIISNFDHGESGIQRFFGNMFAAGDELTQAFDDALESSSALTSSCWLPSPPDISFLQSRRSHHAAQPHTEETSGPVQELGLVELRRFYGPTGLRSARRYGIDLRDAWN
ncbi:hypothetical protein RHOSPDRAFT_26147 [Rhodotorula sp. JG-1b]|nr:hypothetical protein RHOSPDRAFT_26147 [Rhodotorula sp. JG-1b]